MFMSSARGGFASRLLERRGKSPVKEKKEPKDKLYEEQQERGEMVYGGKWKRRRSPMGGKKRLLYLGDRAHKKESERCCLVVG